MPQKLILPINKCKLTASWKTAKYKETFGFTHYGVDMVGPSNDRTLYASGNGTVVAVGKDSIVGNVVAVRYTDAVNHRTGKAQDVIFRYFHLDSIAVKAGQAVDKDTRLGVYGNTGQLSTGAHLHLEMDTDTNRPLHTPTVKSSSLLKGWASPNNANDETMTNPLDWLHLKIDAPDKQTYTNAENDYIKAEDKKLPEITGALISDDVRIEGIDVSAHNGTVDWNKVKAAGKKFAFIRVGWAGWDGRIEANGGLDKRFHENMKAAIAAGLDIGVYVYSYCKTPESARIAACETLELVKPYKLTYPIAFDIEDVSDSGTRYDKMSKAENSAIVNAFLSEILSSGYCPILYTYKSFAENYLDMTALSEWEVWIAHYSASLAYKENYGIWQYAGDTGKCPGVTGACDLNIAYKDYAALIAATGLNEPIQPEAPATEPSELDRLREENDKLRQDVINLNAKILSLEAKLEKVKQAVA